MIQVTGPQSRSFTSTKHVESPIQCLSPETIVVARLLCVVTDLLLMSSVSSSSPSVSARAPVGSRRGDGIRPFVRGGLAGVLGWLCIHPADVIKVRLQVSGAGGTAARYTGPYHALRTVAAEEGIAGLYSGLSAALTRQLTYTTLRLGLYSSLKERITDGSPSMRQKFALGLVSGGVASAISTPVEVSMVRMYSDGAAAPDARRGYRHIGDALVRILREEGVRGLWRGATPTIARSMVANCVQLGTYDQAKETYANTGLKFLQDGVVLHLVASTTSGYFYSLATLPIDLAKTRVQNQRPRPDGSLPYTNIVQAMVKIASDEGVLALWKGFFPYFARCGGHTIAMYVFEQKEKDDGQFGKQNELTFFFVDHLLGARSKL